VVTRQFVALSQPWLLSHSRLAVPTHALSEFSRQYPLHEHHSACSNESGKDGHAGYRGHGCANPQSPIPVSHQVAHRACVTPRTSGHPAPHGGSPLS